MSFTMATKIAMPWASISGRIPYRQRQGGHYDYLFLVFFLPERISHRDEVVITHHEPTRRCSGSQHKLPDKSFSKLSAQSPRKSDGKTALDKLLWFEVGKQLLLQIPTQTYTHTHARAHARETRGDVQSIHSCPLLITFCFCPLYTYTGTLNVKGMQAHRTPKGGQRQCPKHPSCASHARTSAYDVQQRPPPVIKAPHKGPT